MTRSTTALVFAMLLGAAAMVSACKAKEAATAPDAAVAPTPILAEPATPAPTPTTTVAPVAKPEPKPLAVGSKIQIEWKGKGYPGVITQVVAKDRYKIHYDGYGPEWDEVIGPNRILARR